MQALRNWLETSATSQAAFAKQLQVSQAFVSQLVAGKSLPSMENLRRIAEITGLSFDVLLARLEEEKPKKRANSRAAA